MNMYVIGFTQENRGLVKKVSGKSLSSAIYKLCAIYREEYLEYLVEPLIREWAEGTLYAINEGRVNQYRNLAKNKRIIK